MWALANITGTSVKARNKVLESGIVDKILMILTATIVKSSMLGFTYWTIQNLCKGKPDPPVKYV